MKGKKIVVLVLCAALFSSTGVQVSAKDYYDLTYGYSDVNSHPYVNISQEVAKLYLSSNTSGKKRSARKVQDFDHDGTKETVQICTESLGESYEVSLSIRINNKMVSKKKINADGACFATYNLGGEIIAILTYGMDHSDGNCVIYSWRNDKLKVLTERKHIGDLCTFVGKDKLENKEVLYISYGRQFCNHYGQKWPKYIMKKYKKYAKKKSASVTRTTYEKYICKGNKLRKIATDHYFYVSDAYD